MTTSGTTSDNEWQRVATTSNECKEMTTSDNKWEWVTASGIMNENDTVHFKGIVSTIKKTNKKKKKKADALLQGMVGWK